jgi:SAM-dependent methyltransferase
MSDDGTLRAAGAGLRPVDWLVAVPDVASRLRRQPPDRVLVLGCADGTSALDLAITFPNTTVYGVDDDAQLVAAAEAAGRRSSARDRVLFLRGDPLTPRVRISMDVVVAVGLLTDESRPDRPGLLALLSALGRMLDPAGLAVLDSPVPLQQSTAVAAGFAHVERVGDSTFGCPAYLLRR